MASVFCTPSPASRRTAAALAALLVLVVAGVRPARAEEVFSDPALQVTARIPDRWVRVKEFEEGNWVGVYMRFRRDQGMPCKLTFVRSGKLLAPDEVGFTEAELAPFKEAKAHGLVHSETPVTLRWSLGALPGIRQDVKDYDLNQYGIWVRVPLAPEALEIRISGMADEPDLEQVLQGVLDSLEGTPYRPSSPFRWVLPVVGLLVASGGVAFVLLRHRLAPGPGDQQVRPGLARAHRVAPESGMSTSRGEAARASTSSSARRR